MAKVKATKPTKGASKAETPKKVAAVKEGRVTKASQTPKSKAKETAKAAASKSDKKSKKAKAPTPEPESDSDEEMTSDSSASSDSESDSDSSASEVESKPAPKANGAAKKAAKEASSDSSSEEDSDSSDSDAEVPAKANGTAKKAAAKDDSSDSSDSDSSEDEAPAPKKAAAKAESSDSDSDSDSDSSEDEAPKAKKAKAAASSDDSDASSDSSDSDSDEEASEESTSSEEAPSKKRKAETEAAPVTKKNKTQNAEGNGSPNLFVGNLSWNVDEDWLGREFEEYAPKAVRIVTDRATGRSKGFGYVEFETVEAATAALNAMKGSDLDGRPLNLDYSTPRPEGQNPRDRANDRSSRFGDVPNKPSDTLFVGNLSFDATPDIVTELFQEYGTITRVSLPTKPEDGMPKGFGYVGFSSVEEAQGAFDALQGADLSGRPVRLDFAAPRSNDGGSRGSFGGRGGGRGGSRGGFGGRGGGRGGSGFGGRGGGRGGARGGRGGFSTNRGGFGDFQGKKTSFD
ncbi:Nucleolin protein nsr1 [Neofusicoccum parvum]|nr:Nucleolin protein nsr1 [Neofusicoccum parvum]